MPRQIEDAFVIDASFDDDIDLDGCQPCVDGRIDGLEHAGHGEVDVVHGPERGVVERVEGHAHAPQAGAGERPCPLAREQRAVRGHGHVVDTVDGRQHLHELLEVAPQQGLSAGETNLGRAEGCEDCRHAGDFFERQQRLALDEREVAPEDLLRHAVRAAEVAAVRDGDPQVAQRPLQGVGEHRSR